MLHFNIFLPVEIQFGFGNFTIILLSCSQLSDVSILIFPLQRRPGTYFLIYSYNPG